MTVSDRSPAVGRPDANSADANSASETPNRGKRWSTLGVVLAASVVLFAIVLGVPRALLTVAPSVRFLAINAAEFALALLLAEGAAKVLRVPRAALGLVVSRRTAIGVGIGAGIGALAATVLVLGGASLGGYSITLAEPEIRALGPIASDALAVFAAAAFEELAFRALLTGTLATAFPRNVALVLPAAVFGIAHASNPGASFVSTTNTVLAGLLLAIYFFKNRSEDRLSLSGFPDLGLATGFHFAWNFALGWLWGAPVSGLRAGHRFFVSDPIDTLWSGGSYGPEATVLATGLFLALAVLALRPAKTQSARV